MLDLAAGAKVTGSGFPLYRGAGLAAAAHADQLVHRRPLDRARHDGDLAADRGQPGLGARHRPDTGQGRADVRRHARRPVSRPDGRGARSPTSTATRSSKPRACRSATSPTRPPSGARLARPARRRAESCASTSSTRSRWSRSTKPVRTRPATLDWMTERAEVRLQRLGLAYRVRLLSTGDMGFTQAKTHDIEVWAPGVQEWLEVSSVSNFRDFQARRMNIRWRPVGGRQAGDPAHAQRVGSGAAANGRGAARGLSAAGRLGGSTRAAGFGRRSAYARQASRNRAWPVSRLAHAALADDQRLPHATRPVARLRIHRVGGTARSGRSRLPWSVSWLKRGGRSHRAGGPLVPFIEPGSPHR